MGLANPWEHESAVIACLWRFTKIVFVAELWEVAILLGVLVVSMVLATSSSVVSCPVPAGSTVVTGSVVVSCAMVVSGSVVDRVVVSSEVVRTGMEQSAVLISSTHLTLTFTPTIAVSCMDRAMIRLKIPSAGMATSRTRASSRDADTLPSLVVIATNSCREP